MSDVTTSGDLSRYERVVRDVITPILTDVEALEIAGASTRAGYAITVTVGEADMGRVIGRGGGTIQAIRNVVEFAGRAKGHVVAIDVVDA
jgi:predicted RNA-binding protein YlqC (UPF0109 family)